MARPIVLVFEELAQPQAEPTTPDLNSIVIGPAYDILDYPDDAAAILLSSTYGQLNQGAGGGGNPGYTPPAVGEAAVTVLGGAYPGQSPGSLVDHASVKATLKFPRVVLGSTYLSSPVAPVIAAKITTDENDQTLVTITGSATNDFVALGIQPGDTIILTSSYGGVEQTFVRTVQSVGEPNAQGLIASGNEVKLRLTQNLPAASTFASGSITAVAGASLVDGETFTLNDGTNTPTIFEFDSNASVVGGHVAVTFTGGDSAATVAAAIRAAINGVVGTLLITAAAPVSATVALTNDVVGAQGNQAITETVANAGFIVTGMSGGSADTTQWTYDTNGEARIERTLPIQQLVDTSGTFVTFPAPGTDKFVLQGAVKLSIALTPAKTVAVPSPATTTVSRTLSYAEIYLGYRALRQDLQQPDFVTNDAIRPAGAVTFLDPIGKLDARNPLAVGLNVALQTSGTAPVYYFGVPSDDLAGHQAARAALESRADLYALIPLTMDPNIIAGYKFENESMADPTLAQSTGVTQKFRVVIGAARLPTNTVVYPGSISGVSSQPSGVTTGLHRTLTIAAAALVDLTSVLPGDSVTIGLVPTGDAQWQNRRGVHTVGHVNSSDPFPTGGVDSAFELIPGNSRWNDSTDPAAPGDIELVIKGQDGTTKVAKLATADLVKNGGTAHVVMKNPTQVGGPYTAAYAINAAVASPQVSLVGFAITVTVNGTSHTTQNVVDALNAHATVSSLLTASVSAGASAIVNSSLSPVSIIPQASSCATTISVNDALYNKLTDTSALFLTAGVKVGDILEFPLDPNDYTATAFTGRTLQYVIAQVLNENALLIANGLDDTGGAANELPHFFARDVANRFVDNALPNALNYRVNRMLTKDDQVLALVSLAQSFKSKRVALVWPDVVTVASLVDGSKARAVASVLSPADDQPGFYIGCQVGGALAGLPPQHGLTNLGLPGITALKHSQGYFSESQLTRISDGGWFVMYQNTPTDLPYCIHQLTTDVSALETGELSVVRNLDFVAISLQTTLKTFLGQYNVLPETLNDMNRAATDTMDNLRSRRVARIGPPLLSGTVTLIKVSDFAADRVELFAKVSIPKPLNTIGLHVVA
jgi:hypothetical protein